MPPSVPHHRPISAPLSAFAMARLTRDMPYASGARRLVRAAGAADFVARSVLHRTACAVRRRGWTTRARGTTEMRCAICAHG